MNKVIGIEGLVGAGKTSICRELIKTIPNSILLNGGNLYRTIVYTLLNSGKDINELQSSLKNIDIKSVMDILGIELKIEDNETVFYVNGQKVEEDSIQSKEASVGVSKIGGIADNSKLFIFAKELIDNLKIKYNIIVSGRALTKIYPEMDYHLFITASLDSRINRKYIQYNGNFSKEEIKETIEQRDLLQKQAGFYEVSAKTKCIDVTECNSVEESTEKILECIC